MTVTIGLEVTDAYQDFDANGLPVPREHRVTATAPLLLVDDSRAELTKMGVDFLVKYFGHSDVSPKDCLVDFADDCRGKADELNDIIQNRSLFHILNADAHVDEIDFNPGMDHADITAPLYVSGSGTQVRQGRRDHGQLHDGRRLRRTAVVALR